MNKEELRKVVDALEDAVNRVDSFQQENPNVKPRPDFGPTQVRSEKELKVGKKYLLHKRQGVLIEVIYKGKGEDPILDDEIALLFEKKDGAKWPQFAEDCNMAPYEDGSWNSSNWIEKL